MCEGLRISVVALVILKISENNIQLSRFAFWVIYLRSRIIVYELSNWVCWCSYSDEDSIVHEFLNSEPIQSAPVASLDIALSTFKNVVWQGLVALLTLMSTPNASPVPMDTIMSIPQVLYSLCKCFCGLRLTWA